MVRLVRHRRRKGRKQIGRTYTTAPHLDSTSNVARSSRQLCVQFVYKKAGLKGLKMDLSNAESTTDS